MPDFYLDVKRPGSKHWEYIGDVCADTYRQALLDAQYTMYDWLGEQDEPLNIGTDDWRLCSINSSRRNLLPA